MTTKRISKRRGRKKKLTKSQAAKLAGYRSGLEYDIARELQDAGVPVRYEEETIRFMQPEKSRRYKPDFILPNGIIIEAKGRFKTADRQKHKYIKKSRPELDIRFVFQNPNARISKKSKTTYGRWCEQHGFQYAAKSIPEAWLRERPRRRAGVRSSTSRRAER